MSQDDPFAFDDSDRTIIVPTPSGKSGRSSRSGSSGTAGQSINDQQSLINLESISETETPTTGLNTLVAAANPLFNIIPHLRTSLQLTNLAELREFLARQIKSFENRAKMAGNTSEKIIPARYALCTLLDETIASTPWGSGEWGKHSLLVMFHKEVSGGEKFFQLLAKLAENPGKNIDLLEFLDICLSFGFEGRYRVKQNGKAELESLRERLVQLIRKERGEYEKELSPHWQATQPERRKLFKIIPLWVLSALCGAILLSIYLSFSYSLNNISDPVFARIQSIRVKTPIPEPLLEPRPAAQPRLREMLQQEIETGFVRVHEENGRSVITLTGDNIFNSGSATITPNFMPVLARIVTALKSLPGNIKITGHTDDRPIRTIRFPSNWHLSQERANSVLSILNELGIEHARLSAEGHADAHPVSSNDTPEGRAHNRRVEITLINAPT